MNKWRKRRELFERDDSDRGLDDVNEQELAKDVSRDDSCVGCAKKDNSLAKSPGKKEAREGSADAQLIRIEDQKELYKERERKNEQKKEAEAFGVFDNDTEQTSVKAKGSERRDTFYKTVITLSMLVSLLIFAFVILGAYSDEKNTLADQSEPSIAESESDTVIREGDRVIYIRDIDEDGSVMTTAEIYSKHGASVVTVVAQVDDAKSIGTGFVLSSDGYIATAGHTLDGAATVDVILQNGKVLEAQIVGKDELSDLALLRVYTDGLVGVELGDSDNLLVGERIVAIGTPYSEEFSGSVFPGSISSCNRTVSVYDDNTGRLEKKMNFVQLSATLGKGCSGCPVFDGYGKVIGVLSARLGDGTNGVCFALPINGAAEILGMIKSGAVPEASQNAVATPAPRLGVLGVASNDNGVRGVRISSFTDNACDAAVKLRAGDVIVSVEDVDVDSYADVSKAMNKYFVGDNVQITVYRSGQYLTFDVELTE